MFKKLFHYSITPAVSSNGERSAIEADRFLEPKFSTSWPAIA
jgi:hypothetical protein